MANPTSNSRVNLRKERTRQALLYAGRKVISDTGVAGLRIQEVTDSADVGLGSFYTYFAGKDDFVQAIVVDSLETLAAAMERGQSGDQDPAIITAEATHRAIRLAFDEPDFAQLLIHLNHSDELFAAAMHPHARTVVARGVELGRFAVPDIDVAVNHIVSGTLGLIRQILAGHYGCGVELAQVELAMRTLGLGTEEARAIAATFA
ncbi:TetR/AcrR family transcriptional regulator [Mycolicibacterium neoaurum]|uniref:TetR/AcrR family transcriptional regulator n=1 Tax=Mycolicibacterium neoaurum TaxID=1795 RepID=UPI002673D026|nr:TetR/AcrR family transcriptional regulator [Mycolicibacterium neoaurum]MDO3398984.1 TetR/AcrR family transcriptional regulator [Mycolicibacterium neoaurum]